MPENHEKKKGIKYLLLTICAVFFWIWPDIRAEAALLQPTGFYEDGDVVGFIGDSITHAVYTPVNYVEALYQYYWSRFPQMEVEFRNLGTAGYKVEDVLDIYDQDPAFRGINKAVIMLGTNEAILGISVEEYISSMGELIERLKADGMKGEDILIVSPPVYDQNCALNYDKNGNPRWKFEGRLIEYLDALEPAAREWGVDYLDLHTPMLELTEELQKENSRNTLTTDCIHPNAAGQILLAYYILQRQGAGNEALSEIYLPYEGETQTAGGELTDLYQGEKGLCWTWRPETRPIAVTDGLMKFWELFEAAEAPYRESIRIEGLSEETFYSVWMGETELGRFTGRELGEGLDCRNLETYPLNASAKQMLAWSRERHQKAVKYRNMWIEVMMQRAVFTPEEIQTEYEKWRNADQELRDKINTIVQEPAHNAFRIKVIKEGYSAEELEQDAEQARKEAEEQARKEAEEQARKEAEEQARKEAEEQARREAEEQARREAEEQARKEAEERAEKKSAEESRLRRTLAGSGLTVAVGLVVFTGIRKKGKKKPKG